MSGWTRGRFVAAFLLSWALVLSAGTAAADPDQPPGDPNVAAPADVPAPPPPPALPPWLMPPPPADPLAPQPPAPLAIPAAGAPTGPAAGQDSTPFTGAPPFHPPTFNPLNGSMVGVAKPIMINFQVPIADQPMAERAIHISSIPPVPGKFYWMSPTQLAGARWSSGRPTPR